MAQDKRVKINPTYEELKEAEWLECEEALGARYKEYRRLWNELPQKGEVSEFPLNLDIESTSFCNLKCPMCYRTLVDFDSKHSDRLGFMDLGLYKKIIDEGAKYGLYAIKLNYTGEPLLHKQLPEMIEYAKKNGVVDVQFNTNGVLLRGDLAERVLDAGVDRIIISFDSIKKERYEQIRVGAVFEEVVRNVEDFVSLRNKKGMKKPCVRISMVKMKENLDEVDEFYRFWKERVDLVTFVNYVNYLGEDKEADKRYIAKIDNQDDDFICAQLWQRMFIIWDGTITPCCGDLDISLKLGNAKTDSIYNIWHSGEYQQMRKWHWEGNYRKMAICNKCTLPYTSKILDELSTTQGS